MRSPWLLLLGLAVAGCSSKVTGTVTATEGKLGDVTYRPNKCQSGEHWSYFGVALFVEGDSGSKIEIVQDPKKGWFLKIAIPDSKKMLVLEEDVCKKLDVDIHKTHTRVNNIVLVEGTAVFDCRQGDGRVKGDLKLENCN
jgi:hypothetical protein